MRKICISNTGTQGHTHQFSQSGQSRSHSGPITQCPIARTWESAPKQWAVMAIVEDRSPMFYRFERINWLYLIFKCGKKTKTDFEWLPWCWSSLCLLNLEPVGLTASWVAKVPTDLVKISVKEATHMGLYYIACISPSVRLCVPPSTLPCPRDNSSQIWAGIPKFASNMHHGILSTELNMGVINFAKVILAILTQNSRKFGLSAR